MNFFNVIKSLVKRDSSNEELLNTGTTPPWKIPQEQDHLSVTFYEEESKTGESGMLAYLKIKIVSLAAEAQLIRREEQKWKRHRRYLLRNGHAPTPALARAGTVFFGLKDHRKGIVSDEARWAQLAYGFLRGLKYEQIERPVRKKYVNEKRIVELVCKYSGDTERLSNHSEPQIRALVKEWLTT